MPKYNYEVSLTINSNIEHIQDEILKILSLENSWDPWTFRDPQITLQSSASTTESGAWKSWKSSIIGEGRIELDFNQDYKQIVFNLEFIKPFKIHTKAYFNLHSKDDSEVKITWGISGSLPFFLTWISKKYLKYFEIGIKADLRLGLVRLASHLDPNADKIDIKFIGQKQINTRHYFGIPFDCHKESLSKIMPLDLAELSKISNELKIDIDKSIALYTKIDPIKEMFQGYTALEIKFPTDASLPDNFIRGYIDAGDYYIIEVKGSYDYMEIYWSIAMSMLRANKYSMNKEKACLEEYIKSPSSESNPNEYITRILIPIR